MNIQIRGFENQDIKEMVQIWNRVVEDGIAFPQLEILDEEAGFNFFKEQSHTGVAIDNDKGEIVGLYILHPNNIGRCGHIGNTSYAVKSGLRGNHIGEKLVVDSLGIAKILGFKLLQFNAVVRTNYGALHLYKKLGFKQLGIIPGGFLMKNGHYEDIIPHYIEL